MKFYGHEPVTITPEVLSRMSDDDFFGIMPSMPKCIMCKHCGKETCKRFNDNGMRPYRPWFACDTTARQNCRVCGDVEFDEAVYPAMNADEFHMILDEYMRREPPLRINVFIGDSTDVAYVVPFRDYFNGTWIINGTLLYKETIRYKIDRKSPIGYRLVVE